MSNAADRLRDARTEAGLTARGLSALAGLAVGHVWLIESGTKGMGHKSAAALADALGVSKSWLLFGEGPRRPRRARAA